MAACGFCGQEMHDRVGCTKAVYDDFADGEPRARVPFGAERELPEEWAHCPDCLAPREALHHPGCDLEQCARCGGQSITCGCAVEFRPGPEALEEALAAFSGDPTEPLAFTDTWALGGHPVTSVFHWPEGQDALGWWLFAEEREVSAEILRVAPVPELAGRDPELARMLEALPEGRKAFREAGSTDWLIQPIE